MKRYLLIIAAILAPILSIAQNNQGELKGTVTFRTANGTKMADAGAEVTIYLIDSVKLPSAYYHAHHGEDSIINNSLLATIYYAEWEHTPIGKTQRKMRRLLNAMNAYPEDKLHDLDNVATSIIRGRESRQCAKIIADNNGNYSVKLAPGYYGIIFRSKHLRSHSKAENNGNIVLNDAEIKTGQTTVKNEEML